MEKTKQALLLLKNTINISFPDELDLKGFLGISKVLIINSLDECEAILLKLEEYNNRFEVIILKRDLADLFNKLQKDFSTDYINIKPPLFDSILNKIIKIRFLIRDNYFTVVNEPIKTDLEINKAKEELGLLNLNIEEIKKTINELNSLKEQSVLDITNAKKEIIDNQTSTLNSLKLIEEETNSIKESAIQNITATDEEIAKLKTSTFKDIELTHSEITKLKQSSTEIVNDFIEKQKSSTENEKKINEFLTKVETHATSIETIDKNTVIWANEIQSFKDEFLENSEKYKGLNEQSLTLQSEIEANHKKIVGSKGADGVLIKGYLHETEDLKNKISIFLNEQDKKFKAQYDQIESLLPGATSAGLAEAFEKQRKSYKWPILNWSIVFIIVMVIMTAFSVYLFYIQFIKGINSGTETLTQGLISLMKDLPFFIPTIWLAVFASKQQSQYKRLQQEYVFKEINAKSFYGHKRQIEELMKAGIEDDDLLLKLVTQLVVITSQNPSETLDNKSHEDSPPIFKLIERFFPSNKKNKDEKK
jgi:hypothetical protein